ncbi:MAG: hypothetical protein WD068_00470 [Candidatus Babeliales bacterium]
MKVCWLVFLVGVYAQALTLDRVILATDAHENYIQFWPLVAKAWRDIVGIRPTLALIADMSVEIDQSCGDVIRFAPIPGVPTSLYAQTIRLLLPAYFPDDGCIISDIDMMPLQKKYFIESINDVSDDRFVVYRGRTYDWMAAPRYPMCYIAAKGSIFKEVFKIQKLGDIPAIVRSWYARGFGWDTDELMLYEYISLWQEKTNRLTKLLHDSSGRIDRLAWQFDSAKLKNLIYIDAHMPRPYHLHKELIDQLIKGLGNE